MVSSGTMELTRHLVPQLKAQGGLVVNISSLQVLQDKINELCSTVDEFVLLLREGLLFLIELLMLPASMLCRCSHARLSSRVKQLVFAGLVRQPEGRAGLPGCWCPGGQPWICQN